MSWHASVYTDGATAWPGPLAASVVGRSLGADLWRLAVVNLRQYAGNRWGRIDAPPFGGGPGMVLRADVVDRAIRDHTAVDDPVMVRRPLICLTPRGIPFTQELARCWALGDGIQLVSSRFEGIDQRVVDHWRMLEVRIGDYVLCSGDVAAMVILEACVRLLPGVLGNPASLNHESFTTDRVEHPHFTRPDVWAGKAIPSVLRSGNHAAIARWRLLHGKPFDPMEEGKADEGTG